MITPDGDRSKKRLWFAEKQLAVIKDIDVPAKAVKWDGFTFKVWQQGDLTGGRVIAPMGAVVVCSTKQGVKISVADHWAGAFTTLADLYVLFYKVADEEAEVIILNKTSLEDLALASLEEVLIDGEMVTKDFQTIKFRPMVALDPYGLVDGVSTGVDTVWIESYPQSPGLMPYKAGEAFSLTVTENMFVDLNGNGEADEIKYMTDSSLLFYAANGLNLGGRLTMAYETGWGQIANPWRTIQQLTADWQVMWQNVSYEVVDNQKIIARNFQFPNTWVITKESMIPEDTVPDALRLILLEGPHDLSSIPMGSYSFVSNNIQTFLHCFNLTFTGTDASQYFFDNPDEVKWRLFYSLKVGSTVHVVDSSQFIDLLDTLATVDILEGGTDWENARRMLQQLIGGYPNKTFTVPYDTSMFHAHDGNIYTWTREYGTVKFTPYGLFIASVIVPAEVSLNEGTRPEISYAGTYDTVPLYLCTCNDVKNEIRAVYYGSPFVGWVLLPGVAAELTLVHARPVRVSPTSIFLTGVIKETLTVDDVETEVYSFACLQWKIDEEGLASTAPWQKLGRLPFVVGEEDNFNTCLFGADKLVDDLANYLSPPPVSPQQSVGPYNLYAIGMP